MFYVGDFSPGSTIYIYFNTFSSNDPSASVTITDFVNTDVHIHKDDGLTQRNNAAGITVDVDVDAITGSHFIKIDTADNTVADFFTAGHDFFVRIEGTTVDAGTINAVVGHFSLDNRMVAGKMVSTDIATLASQTSFTLDVGSADNSAYVGCTAIISDIASGIQKCFGIISAYTGASKTVTLAEDPGIFTMAAGDNITIVAASALSNVRTIDNTLQTANDNGADINTLITRVTAAVALASVCTEARLAELDAANLPTDIAAIPTTKTDYSLSAAGIDAILDEVVEGTLTLRQIMRLALAVLAGISNGGGTNTINFRDNADAKNRIQATVDASGNRSAVTLDGA